MKQKFYRLNNILKTDAQYLILLGERSNGKSYAVKEFCLKDFKENGNMFMYLRRADLETKRTRVVSYFSDMYPVVESLFKTYNYIDVYSNNIYLAKLDYETGKVTRGKQIGYVASLSGAVHNKSMTYPTCNNIIFEEFCSADLYHYDECNLLQDFVSTVIRRRSGRVFMIGNVISRVCPYFYEWQLTRIPKQKQGTIDKYEFTTNQFHEDGSPVVIKIAVEYCENSGNNSKMFFGHYAETITSGAWKTEVQAKQPNLNEVYDIIYEFIVEHKGFSFIVQLKVNEENGGFILFVYPNTKNRNIERVITKQFSDSIFITEKLNPRKFEVENIIIDCIRLNKLCFSDNLTGTDFRDIVREMGGIY